MTRALVTLAAGTVGEELLSISGPFLRQWAKRLGARLYVMRSAPKEYPLYGKFCLGRIVADNDRTLFVDVDVIPNLSAMPDVFGEHGPDAVWMHDDLPRLNGRAQWCWDLMDAIADSQGWPRTDPRPAVWNTGVIVASRRHAPAFTPPAKPLPATHCSEQAYTQLNLDRLGVPVVGLAERWNYQWWFHRRMPAAAERPDVLVRHFAGTSQIDFGTNHALRVKLMRDAARELDGSPSRDGRDGRRCLHLLQRTEFRPGCGGWMCGHGCGKGYKAVPGGSCQTCPEFEDDGRF